MPGSLLWVCRVKIRKQLGVSEVLEAGCIVSCLVENAREVIRKADVTVEALVETTNAEEFGGGLGSGGASFAGPEQSAGVVGPAEGCAFANVKTLGTTVLVEDTT